MDLRPATRRMRWTPTRSRVYWLLRAVGPASDVQLERMLPKVPPSSVRSARLDLGRAGLLDEAGMTKDGRRKWSARA